MVSGGTELDFRQRSNMPVISPGGYESPPPPDNCAGCGFQILDRFYLNAAERQWHVNCLVCFRCKSPLDKAMSCYYRDGRIYCKEDYYRLVSARNCNRCGQGIFASELVMRAREFVFHVHCFRCDLCHCPLHRGDHFGMREDGSVLCYAHYQSLLGVPEYSAPSPCLPSGHPGEPGECLAGPYGPYSGAISSQGRKGRPRKKKNSEGMRQDEISRHGSGLSPIDPSGCNLHLTHLEGGGSQSSPPLTGGGGGPRTKRMRTSFKHHQLRTMKSYFAVNQNPDAKDLKQLASKTGLSKRVLQVWFQNARAKWRRNNIKQESMSGMLGGEQSPGSQMHHGGHQGSGGICSPGATSSYSEPSPVHSLSGVPSDGSMSTQMGPSSALDYEGSNPLTPLVIAHHGMDPVHNGNAFHDVFHEMQF